MIVLSFLIGCVTVDGISTMQAGARAVPEEIFNGVYKGDGVRLDMHGNALYTFKAEMRAYSEGGALFMQEKITDNAGITRTYTYRFAKKTEMKYSCVDVFSLRGCSMTHAGDSIVIKSWPWEDLRSDSYESYNKAVYQLLPSGKIIKRSAVNKYLFFFDEEEITSYQKEL
jgi:hypothetical protein